jgi:hypothetical protein
MAKTEDKHNPTPADPISREELEKRIKELAVPLDLDALQRSGIIRKSGSWYEVLDWERLPEGAKAKVSELKTGHLVKFKDSSRAAGKLLKRLK